MRKPSTTGLLLLLLAGTGCWRMTVTTPQEREQTYETTGGIVLFGLVPLESAAVRVNRCPNGIAKVESEHTFFNGFIGALTLGIYTPVTIRFTCAQ